MYIYIYISTLQVRQMNRDRLHDRIPLQNDSWCVAHFANLIKPPFNLLFFAEVRPWLCVAHALRGWTTARASVHWGYLWRSHVHCAVVRLLRLQNGGSTSWESKIARMKFSSLEMHGGVKSFAKSAGTSRLFHSPLSCRIIDCQFLSPAWGIMAKHQSSVQPRPASPLKV